MPLKPRDVVEFRWVVERPWDMVQLNTYTIQCWTGDTWISAWYVDDVFDTRGGPFLVGLDEVDAVTVESFPNREGRVAIAGNAPEGAYRLSPDAMLCHEAEQGQIICDEHLSAFADFELSAET